MRHAKNFMTLNPHSFRLDSTIHKVTEDFVRLNLTSAPVIDDYGTLQGMISEVGLIRIFAMDRMLFGNQKKLKTREKFFDVADTVFLSDPVDLVLRKLMQTKLHRVIVVDNRQTVQGIISPKDIIRIFQGEQSKATSETKAHLHESQIQLKQKIEEDLPLEEAMNHYRLLYENAPYMMHSVDSKGVILASNKKMHELLGYPDGDLVGLKIEQIYAEAFHKDIYVSLDILMSNGEPIQVLSEMKTLSGEIVPVEVQTSIYCDSQGKPIGTVSVTRPLAESFSDLLGKEIEEMLGDS
jgi:PAS domain S-box-containing protein